MKITQITLHNFRQFKGTQKIEFPEEDGIITVIHGENGFGKTALLNAFLWGFYGKDGLTDDFKLQDNLINDVIVQQNKDSASAYVEIEFSHKKSSYILKREINKADTKLILRSNKGLTSEGIGAQDDISGMMPNGISQYLFFNGERIESRFAQVQNSKEIKNAIHQMMGISLLETSADDVDVVIRNLKKEMQDSSSEELKKLIQEQTTITTDLENKKKELDNLKEELDAITKEIKWHDEKLSAIQDLKDKQEERARLVDELERFDKEIRQKNEILKKCFMEDAYSIFTSKLIEASSKIIRDLRAQGKLPSRVDKQFLLEILEKNVCICGRALDKDSEWYKNVESLLDKANPPKIDAAIASIDTAIGALSTQKNAAEAQIRTIVEDLNDIEYRKEKNNNRLDEIHKEIGQREDEEISSIENSRQRLFDKKESKIKETGATEERIKVIKQDLARKDEEIKKSQTKSSKEQVAKQNYEIAIQVRDLFRQILEIETSELRKFLNDEIKEHFNKIITKDYEIEITEDYLLRMTKPIASSRSDVGMSTGEGQLMSLVFIASLVSLVRKRGDIDTSIVRDTNNEIYPLVMDSPFGQLGETFRKGVAKWIPEIAPQVIIMVSPTQWRSEVETVLKSSGRVGKRYLLQYNGKIKNPEHPKVISICGAERTQYIDDGSGMEYTKIVDITEGK